MKMLQMNHIIDSLLEIKSNEFKITDFVFLKNSPYLAVVKIKEGRETKNIYVQEAENNKESYSFFLEGEKIRKEAVC